MKKFKGDFHKDKPVGQFKSHGVEPKWGSRSAYEMTHEPVQPFGRPEFTKNHHSHGSVPNKINYKGF